MTGSNDRDTLRRRRDVGALTWHWPALMLFGRAGFAVAAQAFVAIAFFARSPAPWQDAGAWMPVYGTLVDAGCLAALWRLTRREGIHLVDLVGFDRARLGRDVLLGLVLVLPTLACILAGVYATGWLLFGTLTPPYLFEPLPLPAAIYAAAVFPFVWGLTEQMTYNGYLLPRLQVVWRRTGVAVAAVAVVWSFQHAVMPLKVDANYIVFRLVSPLPESLFVTILYLRLRRVIPLALPHALLDSASVVAGVLLPLLRG